MCPLRKEKSLLADFDKCVRSFGAESLAFIIEK
jgi:hypothetical protein